MPKPLPSLSFWLRELGYATYSQYIKSEHWQTLRANWKPRAIINGYAVCEACLSAQGLQLHHRTYKRLGRENPTDLHLVCDDCHRRIHRHFQASPGRSLRGSTKKILKRTYKRQVVSGRWREPLGPAT